MCSRTSRFFQFSKLCLHFSTVCLQQFSKLPPLNHILALPTWGHKCTVTELQAFEIPKFQTKHPVESFFQNKDIHLEYSNWIHFSISRWSASLINSIRISCGNYFSKYLFVQTIFPISCRNQKTFTKYHLPLFRKLMKIISRHVATTTNSLSRFTMLCFDQCSLKVEILKCLPIS